MSVCSGCGLNRSICKTYTNYICMTYLLWLDTNHTMKNKEEGKDMQWCHGFILYIKRTKQRRTSQEGTWIVFLVQLLTPDCALFICMVDMNAIPWTSIWNQKKRWRTSWSRHQCRSVSPLTTQKEFITIQLILLPLFFFEIINSPFEPV